MAHLILLYQADARTIPQYLEPESVDLVLSGPPYWDEVRYSTADRRDISGISSYEEFLKEIAVILRGCAAVLKPGGILALWCHNLYRKDSGGFRLTLFHADLVKTVPLPLRHCTVWDRYYHRAKPQWPHPSRFTSRYQYILIFEKPDPEKALPSREATLQEEFWNPVWRKKTSPRVFGSTALFELGFLALRPFTHSADFFRKIGNRILVKDPYRFSDYATSCPPEVAERIIKKFSCSGQTVLDPFAGTATTLAVAQRLGRNGIGFEINPLAIEAARKKLGKSLVVESIPVAKTNNLLP